MSHSEGCNRRKALILGASAAGAAFLPGLLRAQGREWRWQTAARMPLAVQEIYPAAIGGRIHVAGGLFATRNGGFDATARHVVYDPAADAWRDAAPLPQARHHPNLVGTGDRLFALGGFRRDNAERSWAMQAQTWIYDAAADAWSEGVPAPGPHAETVCAALAGNIHVVGGRRPLGRGNARWQDHADTDRHLVLEAGASEWLDAAPAPTARNSAAGAVIDGRLYVVGGRTVGGGNVASTEIYDPADDRWRRAAPMPQAQGGLAAAALYGRLFAFGGEYFSDRDAGVHAEAWMYEPEDDRWSALPPMPTPRHGLGAVTLDERIYVIGGATSAGAEDTSDVVEMLG